MKFTIEGFSQEYAATLKKTVTVNGKEKLIKIDCTDLVILRWFVDFFPNMRKMYVNGQEYALLVHKKLVDDLPILDISRKACIERMQKLVEFGILKYELVKEGGTYSLYGFGENYINLVKRVAVQTDTGCTVETTGGVRSNGHGVYVQTDNKDKSIINESITIPKKERKSSSFDDLIDSYSKGDEEVKDLLGEWLKVRKAKRAAMTNRAIELNLQKLESLAAESKMSVANYLREVICRGWQAFYPIKTYNNYRGGNEISQAERKSDLDDVF